MVDIVSKLILMHDEALNAGSELMMNAVLDKLLQIGNGQGTLLLGLVQMELTDQEGKKLGPLVRHLSASGYSREQPAYELHDGHLPGADQALGNG